MCVVRVLLVPLVICPQRLGVAADASNWVALGAIFVLGFTNGFVSTVGMMQVHIHGVVFKELFFQYTFD